jgi:hypothetical protein
LIQKFISKLSSKEKILLYITVGIVFVALFERLFLGPVFANLNQIDEQIKEKRVDIIRNLRIVSYEDQILERYNAFEDYFVDEMKSDSDINAQFLRAIETLATNSNVKLVKSNASESEKKDKFSEYYANLDCTGRLRDIITFIHEINSSDSLLKVVKLDMTPKRGDTDEMTASMTISKMLIPSGETQLEDAP